MIHPRALQGFLLGVLLVLYGVSACGRDSQQAGGSDHPNEWMARHQGAAVAGACVQFLDKAQSYAIIHETTTNDQGFFEVPMVDSLENLAILITAVDSSTVYYRAQLGGVDSTPFLEMQPSVRYQVALRDCHEARYVELQDTPFSGTVDSCQAEVFPVYPGLYQANWYNHQGLLVWSQPHINLDSTFDTNLQDTLDFRGAGRFTLDLSTLEQPVILVSAQDTLDALWLGYSSDYPRLDGIHGGILEPLGEVFEPSADPEWGTWRLTTWIFASETVEMTVRTQSNPSDSTVYFVMIVE